MNTRYFYSRIFNTEQALLEFVQVMQMRYQDLENTGRVSVFYFDTISYLYLFCLLRRWKQFRHEQGH